MKPKNSKSPFTDEEKAAMRREGLRPEEWEIVWRDGICSTFIVKKKGGSVPRTIDKRQNSRRL